MQHKKSSNIRNVQHRPLLTFQDIPNDELEPGHVRSPILSRQPSMLESFSRTVRTYVPSSIPIPSAAPTPPRLSLSSMSPSHSPATQHLDSLASSQDDLEASVRGVLSYPGAGAGEHIVWSRFDTQFATRRLLLLGYRTGLQVWDCTDLGSVSEIINLRGKDWTRVAHAAVLPEPSPDRDSLSAVQRPCLGLVTGQGGDAAFVVYSLQQHATVSRIAEPGLVSFEATENFIVLSTASPTALHVLSATSFTRLYTVPPSALALPSSALYSYNDNKNYNNNNERNTNVPSYLDISTSTYPSPPLATPPTYALSHRLLAYASPAPPPQSSPHSSPTSPSLVPAFFGSPASPAGSDTPPADIGSTDLGTTALRVGGTVLTGVRALGGMAYAAAKSRARTALSPSTASASASPTSTPTSTSTTPGAPPSATRMFFSRSAPAASGSHAHAPSGEGGPQACYITVLDLAPLLASSMSAPQPLIPSFATRTPVEGLAFTADGTAVCVVPKDGRGVSVLRVSSFSSATATASLGGTQNGGTLERVYDLHRGRTTAQITSVLPARDGQWLALATRRRTVHVFAVNPYGGTPEGRGHVEGVVRNSRDGSVTGSGTKGGAVTLAPVVRLRASRVGEEETGAPLALAFVDPPLPPSLRPQQQQQQLQAQSGRARTGVRDMLVFDPVEGMLSLRRIALALRMHEAAAGVGRLSVSAPSASGARGKAGRTAGEREVVARESVVATWSLQRGADWAEVRQSVAESRAGCVQPKAGTPLSHAELSTFSTHKTTDNTHRPIYLSHQFTFHTLGEDYHALIRQHHLHITGARLEVRRAVPVSAYGTGGEAFVSSSAAMTVSSPRDILRAGADNMGTPAASFDEPLASAIAAGLDTGTPPAVLPMLPNGHAASYGHLSVSPIKAMAIAGGRLSDGMSEGLGRLTRELRGVRPPRLMRGEGVALEFDEAEEDFMFEEVRPDGGGGGMRSSEEGSTPSTGAGPLLEFGLDDVQDDDDAGWGAGDVQAVMEDLERFDHISVVGLLDEEQAEMEKAEKAKRKRRGKKRTG